MDVRVSLRCSVWALCAVLAASCDDGSDSASGTVGRVPAEPRRGTGAPGAAGGGGASGEAGAGEAGSGAGEAAGGAAAGGSGDGGSAGAGEGDCVDGIRNGDETDIDCGGDCAPCPVCECAPDDMCDCPAAPNCMDALVNGAETDVDCGGAECAPCPSGSNCLEDADCESAECLSEICS